MTELQTNVLYYGDNLDILRRYLPDAEGHSGAAKFWLEDLALASSRGYTRHQLDQITDIVAAHQAEFVSRWHEFFG